MAYADGGRYGRMIVEDKSPQELDKGQVRDAGGVEEVVLNFGRSGDNYSLTYGFS